MIFARKEHFGSLVFNPFTAKYYHLDAASTESLAAVATGLAAHEAAGRVRQEIGIPSSEPFPPVSWIYNDTAFVAALSAPKVAQFNIIRRSHSSPGNADSAQLSVSCVRGLFRELVLHGVFKVTLAGGEPLHHDGFEEIIRALEGSPLDVSIVTNGIPVTESGVEVIEQFAAIRKITISLGGATAADNDAVRGPNSFVRAVQGLRRFRRLFSRAISVRLILRRTNVERHLELPRLLKDWGIGELEIWRALADGYDSVSRHVVLTDAEYAAACDELHGECARVGVTVAAPIVEGSRDQTGQITLCRAGMEFMEIDADGAVYPCSYSSRRFRAGNVTTDPIAEILLNLQRHSINNEWCYACQNRGGRDEKPAGYVPPLVNIGVVREAVNTQKVTLRSARRLP